MVISIFQQCHEISRKVEILSLFILAQYSVPSVEMSKYHLELLLSAQLLQKTLFKFLVKKKHFRWKEARITLKNALKLGEVHNVMKIAIPLHYSL